LRLGIGRNQGLTKRFHAGSLQCACYERSFRNVRKASGTPGLPQEEIPRWRTGWPRLIREGLRISYSVGNWKTPFTMLPKAVPYKTFALRTEEERAMPAVLKPDAGLDRNHRQSVLKNDPGVCTIRGLLPATSPLSSTLAPSPPLLITTSRFSPELLRCLRMPCDRPGYPGSRPGDQIKS
jgi:hypothetical protein